MLLFVVTGLFLITCGENDCGLNRLYPSGITASDTSTSANLGYLIDGKYSTEWTSTSGAYVSVYFTFSTDVDIKHIMVREGTYYVDIIYVYDDITSTTMSWTNYADTEDYKIYNFWFPEFITQRVRIYFSGSQTTRLTVSDVLFWGCNMTSTAPTAAPTVSPSQTPTNSTPTVEPTIYPSMSPTQVPTNMISIAPTAIPTLSPSQMPTNSRPTVEPTMQPSVSPTQVPTNSYMSAQPTVLPTISPTDMPLEPSTFPTVSPTRLPTISSVEPSISPTPIPTERIIDSNDDHIIAIGVAEFLGVVLFFLMVVVIFLCFKLHITMKSRPAKLQTMLETHELKDNL